MRFSIVLPTYKRADKLRLSLTSALNQDFDDYEVVVSNNAADEATQQVVSELADHRVKYVETQQCLSMVDHWEFALNQASGKWVLMLCDDDALLAKCLSYLDQVIDAHPSTEIVFYDMPTYVYGDGVRDDGDFLNVGEQVPFTTKRVDSRRQLKKCFWQLSGDMPKMLNSAVHRDLLARLRDQYDGVFGRWAPDYAVGSKLLANTSHYIKTGPLALWGENMSSYGSGAQQDPDHCLGFFQQFPEFSGRLPHSPYPQLFCVTAIIYETLCMVRQQLKLASPSLRIDPTAYRRMLLADIDRYAARGDHRYAADREVIQRDLQKFAMQRFFHPAEVATRFSLRWQRQIEKQRERSLRRRKRSVSGPEVRRSFGNILEAAGHVSAKLVRV